MRLIFLIGSDLESTLSQKVVVDASLAVQEEKLKEVTRQYERLKTFLDQKEYSQTRGQNTETSLETISSNHSSVRYRRLHENSMRS